MWRVTKVRHRNERGITGLFVLFFMVALLGSLGLVIDLGLVRQERRELQNGADAAALALAQECALNQCTNLSTKAEPYADANAKDNASAVTSATRVGDTVKVDTRSETTGGATSLTMQFAQLVGGPATSTVRATATAGWGSPGGARAIPLTISYCEWNSLTGTGATFPTAQRTILFHDPKGNQNTATPCSGGPAGQNLPGGFGWLDTVSNTICGTDITAGGWFGSAPGNSPPNTNNSGCSPLGFLNTDLLIPVFQAVDGTGQNGRYRIYGLATFRITRMRLGGNGSPWTTSPAPPNCTPAQRCIYGSFQRDIIPWTGGPLTGGANLGTFAVKLVA
jgi:Flp pilus assembly protein TadG